VNAVGGRTTIPFPADRLSLVLRAGPLPTVSADQPLSVNRRLAAATGDGFIPGMQIRFPLVAALAVVWVGCRKDEVRVYEAPKDAPAPAMAAASPTPGTAAPAARDGASADRPSVPWTVPAGWEERPNASGMRVASYGVTTADGRSVDISVVALGEQAGTELDNVNRWRQQLKLEAATPEQLATMGDMVPIGKTSARLYDLASTTPILDGKYKARTLAAMLGQGRMTVFFKAYGEDALVQEQKPKVLAWLASVQAGGGEAEANPPARPTVPGGTPPPSAAAATTPGGGGELPAWEVPAGWKAGGPRPMRLASFEIPGGATPGDVSISALSSGGGGLLANVNRWRGQVGLGPVDETQLTAESQAVQLAGGQKGTVVDLAGAKSRILGAIVPVGDRVWFFKLTGDNALVGREKANFVKFVESARF
jgi:hypothetical protein